MASTMTSAFLAKPVISFAKSSLAGKRVAIRAAPRTPPTTIATPVAIFKNKVAPANNKKGVQPVKAQQFKLGLTKDKSKTVTLGFTKANELFVGRWAMLGFAASLLGEVITGKGALAQLGIETGVSLVDLDGFVLALVAFNLLAALAPASGKFIPEEDFSDRPAGALQDPSISILNTKKFFGIKGFGFTKENELFVGRLAQLGFAFSLIGEAVTGKGALAQIGLETGIPLSEAEPLLIFSILFTLFAAINEGSGRFEEE